MIEEANTRFNCLHLAREILAPTHSTDTEYGDKVIELAARLYQFTEGTITIDLKDAA